MSISSVVLGGFGNGTVVGSVNLLPTMGYSIGEAVISGHAVVGELSVFQPGMQAGMMYYPGRQTAVAYNPGQKSGVLYSPGQQIGRTFNPGMKAGEL